MSRSSFLASLFLLILPIHIAHAGMDGYFVTQRTLHSRLWQKITLGTNEQGVVRATTNSYTELRNGLCREENGALVDSADGIDLTANGATASRGQHRVHWAANANTPGGAVTLQTSGRQILNSRVFGICYYDSSSGANLLIAI